MVVEGATQKKNKNKTNHQEQPSAPDPFAETTKFFANFNEQHASVGKLCLHHFHSHQPFKHHKGKRNLLKLCPSRDTLEKLKLELPSWSKNCQHQSSKSCKQKLQQRPSNGNHTRMLNFERRWRRSSFLREVSKPELRERHQLSRLLGHIPPVRLQD